MAKILSKSLELIQRADGEDPIDFYDRQYEAFNKFQETHDVISFPVADGYASYHVVKMVPLTLQHIDVGDGYHADPCLIRGLRKADVIRIVSIR